MNYVQDKAKQVSETVQGGASKASAEQDKEVAKGNTNAGVGAQAAAAKDYLGDKSDQKKHETNADVHDAKSSSR